jgi:prepilin-type processing-associated H-X9-DG protein
MKRPAAVRLTRIGIAVLLGLFMVGLAFKLFVVESLNQIKCASDLSAIGQCILLYTNDHHGHLPADLGTLAWEEDIIAEVFICPDSDTVAPSSLPQAQFVAWVNTNSDYIFVGAGMNFPSPPTDIYTNWKEIVLAYEKEENHHGKGMNVLFGDGRVEWMTIDAAHREIAASKAKRATTFPSFAASSRP